MNENDFNISIPGFLLLILVLAGMFLMGYSLLESKSNPGLSLRTMAREVIKEQGLKIELREGSYSASREKPVLRIWVTYNSEQFQLYRKVARRFEQRENVVLKISRIPWSGQSEFLQYAANSHRAPDIARMDLGIIPKFAAGGALLPLTFSMEDLEDKLLPAALDAAKVRDRDGNITLFGLPDEFTTLALYYNREHFRRADLDPDRPPKNWDEFRKIAKLLTRDTDQDGSDDQFGFAMNVTPWFSMPFLFSFGGKILDDQKLECLLNEQAAIDALDFQVALSRDGLEAGAWQQLAIPPDAGFKSGRYSMVFSGPWNLENFRRSGVDFAVALIPGNPLAKVVSSTNVGGNANVIFKTSKHPDMAIKFLKYLLSAEVQTLFCNELGSIPLRVDVQPAEHQMKNKELTVFMEQSLYAGSRPKIPGYDRIEDIITKEVETAFKGDRTPRQAYEKACRNIESMILRDLK